jgi:hypothetical protein
MTSKKKNSKPKSHALPKKQTFVKSAAARSATKKKTRSSASNAVVSLSPQLFSLPDTAGSFSGVLTLTDNQASLSGTLLLYGATSDIAAAIHAAADVLARQGFHTGQSIVVTGTKAVVHFDDHPLVVIVMTDAHAN